MEQAKTPGFKLIHVGRIQAFPEPEYLFLRQKNNHEYQWFRQNEEEASLSSISVAEAIQKARKQWKMHDFRTVNCGFRYTLPERDEHGCNALFCQMVASYSSPNGIYFDEELGHNCFVNFASLEARTLMAKLK